MNETDCQRVLAWIAVADPGLRAGFVLTKITMKIVGGKTLDPQLLAAVFSRCSNSALHRNAIFLRRHSGRARVLMITSLSFSQPRLAKY